MGIGKQLTIHIYDMYDDILQFLMEESGKPHFVLCTYSQKLHYMKYILFNYQIVSAETDISNKLNASRPFFFQKYSTQCKKSSNKFSIKKINLTSIWIDRSITAWNITIFNRVIFFLAALIIKTKIELLSLSWMKCF